MPNKSIWDSRVWKFVVAIGIVLGILSSWLQISGKVDFWGYLILPIVNFFIFPVPLYSIPLAFIVVIVILLVIGSAGGSKTITSYNMFDKADILDHEEVRYIAVLCKTPRTTDFLSQKYQEFRQSNDIHFQYSFEDCLKQLEHRELLVFQNQQWVVTQKALDYIAKYHG